MTKTVNIGPTFLKGNSHNYTGYMCSCRLGDKYMTTGVLPGITDHNGNSIFAQGPLIQGSRTICLVRQQLQVLNILLQARVVMSALERHYDCTHRQLGVHLGRPLWVWSHRVT